MLREAEAFAVSAVWSGFQRWYPLALVFGIAMACDYISGILAAKKETLENPDNAELGLSSKEYIEKVQAKKSKHRCEEQRICRRLFFVGEGAWGPRVFFQVKIIQNEMPPIRQRIDVHTGGCQVVLDGTQVGLAGDPPGDGSARLPVFHLKDIMVGVP